MKTERVAPWVFITAAVLVFFLFILVTAQITSVLASTSRFQLNAKNLFVQDAQSVYLPMLNKAGLPEAIIIDHTARDASQIPNIWLKRPSKMWCGHMAPPRMAPNCGLEPIT